MRDTLVRAINTYATARISGDGELVNFAGNRLNSLLDEVFATPADAEPAPAEGEPVPPEVMEESVNLDGEAA